MSHSLPAVTPVARAVTTPVAVFDKDWFASGVHQLCKVGEVFEFATAVKFNPIKPKVDGCLDVTLVVADAIVLSLGCRWAPRCHVLMLVAPTIVTVPPHPKACHDDESSECTTARQHKMAEVACYRTPSVFSSERTTKWFGGSYDVTGQWNGRDLSLLSWKGTWCDQS